MSLDIVDRSGVEVYERDVMIDRISPHLTAAELEAGLDHIRHSPKDNGVLDLIVRRPTVNEREVLEAGELDLFQGLVGDYLESPPQ